MKGGRNVGRIDAGQDGRDGCSKAGRQKGYNRVQGGALWVTCCGMGYLKMS